jgi:signal transduction histidine kinase
VHASIGIDRRIDWRRVLAAGLSAAAFVGLAGGAFELWRLGRSDAAAAARVERHVQERFAEVSANLAKVAGSLAVDRSTAKGLAAPADEARLLFDLVSSAVRRARVGEDVAVTIYDVRENVRAWVGRASEIAAESDRVKGPAAFFLAQSTAGLRLVYVEPVMGSEGGRVGTVAAEYVLSPRGPDIAIRPIDIDYTLPTAIAPVSLVPRGQGGGGDVAREGAFVLRAPSGEVLAEAAVAFDDLRATRLQFRRVIVGAVLAACGITLCLLIGPLLDRRASRRTTADSVRTTVAASGLLLAAAGTIGFALSWPGGGTPQTAMLLLWSATAAALAALWAGPASRLPIWLRSRRSHAPSSASTFVMAQLAAAVGAIVLIIAFVRLLDAVVDPSAVDLRHFSLHPWSSARMMLLGGLVAGHAAVLWTATLLLSIASAVRGPAPLRQRRWLFTLWMIPAAAAAVLAVVRGWALPVIGVWASTSICALAALAMPRVTLWYRHTTVAARIFGLFLAFLIPALLLYPPVDFFASRATEALITSRFAVQAQEHPQTIQERMNEARAEIDGIEFLVDLVSQPVKEEVTAESAFAVWSQTVLARERMTSSVELYAHDGELLSRFAMNLPEYTGATQKPQPTEPCEWDLFGEAAPFGSEERSLLHAERHICVFDGNGGEPQRVGTIVVHVMLDYRTLPFISSQSPYFEVFRSGEGGPPAEGTPGGEVELAIYGWSRRPVYSSGRAAWLITDQLFNQIYSSRDPFWAETQRGDERWRVYFSNDRWRIFAIGYPRLTLFDRFVHIAELTTLAGAACVVVLIATGIFTRMSRQRPAVGRALLREIRASFYRKLFLAFVLAAIIPALTLAIVIRTYFAELLWDDVQAAAARTAAVAKRVIEGSEAIVRGTDGAALRDDVMVWISQVIDQDVNIFRNEKLLVTSERDLFASGLLPERTPDDVYRAIAIDGLPSFVGEDTLGTFPYVLAAAPVKAGGGDAILTVPLTTRQREIEREIDELDRGVHLAALFFILLGAGIGLSLAERIADPVRRLTLATRRIAEGDFDARIAVRSADELKRLVDAFNSMAAELKAQRAQLERTHRLEAWAEMARQVAHEIKNPLTPIQLSAEHLRRVHADRGEPMGPVLETCVSSILGQVRLLRHIAGEFSSFASSPTARRVTVDVSALVAEVVDPYRTGLGDRITIDNQVQPPLPSVLVDRTLIARALVNIVENALHAMPSRGTLTLGAEVEEGFVLLRARDTGAGMDDEALERVFEPYFSTKATGTGLGLPIARRNVEASGGTIEVQSARGQGTTVTMRLPTT